MEFFNYMLAPTLKSKRLILKTINAKEAKNFLRWLKDPEVERFLKVDGSKLNYKKEIEFIKKARLSKSKIVWSIYTKNGEHLGSTGLQDIDLTKNKKAIWGIVIGDKNFWRQGYGTEVLKTILKFSFTKLKLNRVELFVYKGNVAGLKCYKKCGFKKEGVKRESALVDGKLTDEIIMGILKKEYK